MGKSTYLPGIIISDSSGISDSEESDKQLIFIQKLKEHKVLF